MKLKHILTIGLLAVMPFSGCTRSSDGIESLYEANEVPIQATATALPAKERADATQELSFSAGKTPSSPTATPQATEKPTVAATSTQAETPEPDTTSNPTATPRAVETPAPKPEVTPKPVATATLIAISMVPTVTPPTVTPMPAPEPPLPAPISTPAETPPPEEEMTVEGDGYGNKVLTGVNEVRAINGLSPLSYGGSGSLMDRCKEMAQGGTLFAPTGSNESTSKSNDGGKTMGIMSAVHAWGIGNGDYSILNVASVVYNGTRWTIVSAE